MQYLFYSVLFVNICGNSIFIQLSMKIGVADTKSLYQIDSIYIFFIFSLSNVGALCLKMTCIDMCYFFFIQKTETQKNQNQSLKKTKNKKGKSKNVFIDAGRATFLFKIFGKRCISYHFLKYYKIFFKNLSF